MNNQFQNPVIEDLDRRFAYSLKEVDEVIQSRQDRIQSPWRTMVERGKYKLGQGLVKHIYRFHAGLGDQAGLQRWRPIQLSKPRGGDHPGISACQYNPYRVSDGLEEIEYTGFQTERETDDICLKDIKWAWQFKQQLTKKMEFLGDITSSVWENYAREQYIKFAIDNGRGYIMSEGPADQHTFTYDPFSVDGDGDNTMVIPASIPVSTFNFNWLRWWMTYFQIQAKGAALGEKGGMPVFGVVFDVDEFWQMIMRSDALREDWRYHKAEVLIERYGQVHEYQNWSLIHDPLAPRMKIKSSDGTDLTLKRILPLEDSEVLSLGTKPNVNQDFLNAEYGMAICLIKDVFMIEVPPAGPESPGGGTNFGATPGLNGEFAWLNIRDRILNPLNEIGNYFARFEAFAKPLDYNDEAFVFIFKRCVYIETSQCNIGGDSQAAPSASVALASTPVAGDRDTTNNTLTLTLASILACETPSAVEVVTDNGDGNTTHNGIIADSSNAPTYMFAFGATPPTIAAMTHTDGASVNCVTPINE